MIQLYYNSKDSIGKQAVGFVKSSDKKVQLIDISKDTVTPTQWAEICKDLSVDASHMVNQEHPDFTSNYKEDNVDLEKNDWLTMLSKNPLILAHPVLLTHKKAMFLKTPSDFVKIQEADSATIEKE
ncbi:arsenate reductase family protein [Croceivirga lutea]|uniref:arsenate reductase family protein n=1 Tax=Croceivirga lutea TaxID=1775167 RepID=UPI00163ACD23|nr:hypothetical protein [Croceivirga lutea]